MIFVIAMILFHYTKSYHSSDILLFSKFTILILSIFLSGCTFQNEKEKCYSQLRDFRRDPNYHSNENCLILYLFYQTEENKKYKSALDKYTYECLQSRRTDYECGKKSEMIPTSNSGSGD